MIIKSVMLICVFSSSLFLMQTNASAQTGIAFPQTDVVFKKKGDKANIDGVVNLSWTVSFNCKKTKLTMIFKNGATVATETREFGVPENTGDDVITKKLDEVGGGIVSIFQTKVKFGGSENLSAKTNTLTVQIAAVNDVGAEVTRTEEVPLTLIKKVFNLNSTSQTSPGDAPKLSNVQAQDLTTSSMRISAISTDLNIFAAAIAVQTANVTDANGAIAGTNSIPKVTSDPVACLKNKQCTFQLSKLKDGEAYIVFVREFEPPDPNLRGSAGAEPLTVGPGGGQLATLSNKASPKAVISVPPINIKNEQLAISAQISRATKLVVKLYEKDKLDGQFNERAKKEFTLPPEFETANDRIWTENVPFSLKEGSEYEVQLVAFSSTPGLKEEESKLTDPFKGLPLKLFENLQLDVTNPTLELKPVGANEPLKLTALAQFGSIATIPFTCEDGKQKCVMDTKAQAFVDQLKVNSGDAPADSTSQVQATLKITVTANATDKSQRTQSQVFELTFTGQKKAGGGSAGQKFSNFVKSVFTGTDNKSLDSGQLRGTGFGSFLGMVLRLFL